MSNDDQYGIAKWAGIYNPTAEFWGSHFYPLLIEPSGEIYLHETKLTYTFDAGTDTLSFQGQVVRGATPLVKVRFTKGADGKNTFDGVMYPQPGDGPGSFRGVQMLKTQVWAVPTGPMDLPIIGRTYIGDHTWVSMGDGNCWNVVGGGPGYYCGANRWRKVGSTNVYFPPEGRLLSSTAEGNSGMTNCLGGTQTGFLGIPLYAGIVYGLHGVCHQMANRMLLGAGKQTVWGANGYALSVTNYGLYGVTMPKFLNWMFLIPFVGSVILAYTLGINIAFGVQCGGCGAPYPGPILAENETGSDHERRLTNEVLRVHAKRAMPADAGAVFSMKADDIVRYFEDEQSAHTEEMRLYFNYKMGHSLSEAKIGHVLAHYQGEFAGFRDAVMAVAGKMPKSAAAMADIEVPAIFNPLVLAASINQGIIKRQQEVANILTPTEYAGLFDHRPDMKVGLVDPRIMTGATNF